jgi:hypothetical protein
MWTLILFHLGGVVIRNRAECFSMFRFAVGKRGQATHRVALGFGVFEWDEQGGMNLR